MLPDGPIGEREFPTLVWRSGCHGNNNGNNDRNNPGINLRNSRLLPLAICMIRRLNSRQNGVNDVLRGWNII